MLSALWSRTAGIELEVATVACAAGPCEPCLLPYEKGALQLLPPSACLHAPIMAGCWCLHLVAASCPRGPLSPPSPLRSSCTISQLLLLLLHLPVSRLTPGCLPHVTHQVRVSVTGASEAQDPRTVATLLRDRARGPCRSAGTFHGPGPL